MRMRVMPHRVMILVATYAHTYEVVQCYAGVEVECGDVASSMGLKRLCSVAADENRAIAWTARRLALLYSYPVLAVVSGGPSSSGPVPLLMSPNPPPISPYLSHRISNANSFPLNRSGHSGSLFAHRDGALTMHSFKPKKKPLASRSSI
ncbi:hypothetical protein EDB81DRAFT_495434 [Dactylonectria macrodidyma]|uniref:Uncharacterized protein n=1 Tax=Dactylonectria macrodidyma TaxID=307937 RepID=A0A9P9EWW6_9HYPO|nr:hypothetical protein EDB81DRAFT_495434 [Dactylonectria macrodidyma]